MSLNESPSEKEGKSGVWLIRCWRNSSLNESPSEKEGKFDEGVPLADFQISLNESPSEKEGKSVVRCEGGDLPNAPQ